MALERQIRTTYHITAKLQKKQADAMLKELNSSFERLTKDMNETLKGIQASITTLTEKQEKSNKLTKDNNNENTKLLSLYNDINKLIKEKNSLIQDTIKLESSDIYKKKIASYKGQVTRIANLIKKEKDSTKQEELKIKLANYKKELLINEINFQKAIKNELDDQAKKLKEIEKSRLIDIQLLKSKRELEFRPPTTLDMQEAELLAIREKIKLEQELYGKTEKYYTLLAQESKQLALVEKTKAEQEKQKLLNNIKLEVAKARQQQLNLDIEKLQNKEKIKQSDLVNQQLNALKAELKVLKSKDYFEHTITEQARIQSQIDRKKSILLKTLANERKQELKDKERIAKVDREIEVYNVAKNTSSNKRIDILKEELKVLEQQLKTNKDLDVIEQKRIEKAISIKNREIKSQSISDESTKLTSIIKHAATVAPIYMGVAQTVGLLEQALGSAITTASEFDLTMRTLTAVTNANIDKTKELTAGVMQLGTIYGGQLTDYAQSIKSLARAGIDTNELVEATKVTSQLSLITGDTLDSATNAVASYIQVYQKAGNKLVYTTEQIGEKLAYMANASRLSTEDIGVLSNYALDASKSIGLTIDTVNGLAIAFSNAGTNASTIGTQIRRFVGTLTSNATSVKEFYQLVGTNRAELLGKLSKSKSGLKEDIEEANKAFEDFVRNIQSLSENEYRQAIQGMNILDNQFFNKLRNNGDEIIKHIEKSFSGLNGELDKTGIIAQSVSKRWESMINNMLSSIEPVVTKIEKLGTNLTEDFISGLANARDLVDKLFEPVDNNVNKQLSQLIQVRSTLKELRDILDSDNESAATKQQAAQTIVNINKEIQLGYKRKELLEEGKDLSLQEKHILDKLHTKTVAYFDMTKAYQKGDLIYKEEINQKLQEELKALDLKYNKELQLDNIKKIKDAKNTIYDAEIGNKYIEANTELTLQDKARIEYNNNLIESKKKEIELLATQARLSDDVLKSLGLEDAVRNNINSRIIKTKSLSDEEKINVSIIAQALSKVNDLQEANIALKAIQAEIDRNTLATKQQLVNISSTNNELELSGVDTSNLKLLIGEDTLSNLIEQQKWTEAIANIDISQLEIQNLKSSIQDEINKLLVAQVDLTGNDLEVNKNKVKQLEEQLFKLDAQNDNLSVIKSTLSTNLKIVTTTKSAYKHINDLIATQFSYLDNVTKNLRTNLSLVLATNKANRLNSIEKTKNRELEIIGEEYSKLTNGNIDEVTKKKLEYLKQQALKTETYYNKLKTKELEKQEKEKVKIINQYNKIKDTIGLNRVAKLKQRYKKDYENWIKNGIDKEEAYTTYIKRLDSIDNKHNVSIKYKKVVKDTLKDRLKELEINQRIVEARKLLNGEDIKQSDKLKAQLNVLKYQYNLIKDTKKKKELLAKILEKEVAVKKATINETKKAKAEAKRKEEEYYKQIKEHTQEYVNKHLPEWEKRLYENVKIANEQVAIIDEQIRKQKELNSLIEDSTKSILQSVFAGDSLGEAISKAVDDFNAKNLNKFTDDFSKAIADAFDEGFSNIDWENLEIFKDGKLTKFGESAVGVLAGVGQRYATGNTSDDSKNERTGKDVGGTTGTAIGAYFGGAIGAEVGNVIGTAVGGAIGRAFGGSKSKYIKVDDGSMYVEQRTSGGQWKHDKYKVLEDETQAFLYDFDKTIKLYDDLYQHLGMLNEQIDIEGGKYSTEELYNEIIPKEFFSDLYSGIYDNAHKAKEGFAVVVDSIKKDAFVDSKVDEVYTAWKNYSDAIGTSITQAIVDSLNAMEETNTKIFEYVNRNNQFNIFENNKDIRDTSIAKDKETLGLENVDINVTNFIDLYNKAIEEQGQLLPEQIQAWNNLGNTLLASRQELDSYVDYYRSNFLTTEQQYQYNLQNLKQVYDSVGLAVPTTKEEFVKLIDSLDTTTESGERAYYALISSASALNFVQQQAMSIAQEHTDSTVSIYGYIDEYQSQIDSYNQTLLEQQTAIQDEQSKAYQAQIDYINKIKEETDKMIADAHEAFQSTISDIEGVNQDSSTSLTSSLIAYNEAVSEYQALLKNGIVDEDKLKDSYSNILDLAKNISGNEYFGDGLKEALLGDLRYNESLLDTTDIKAYVQQVEIVSDISSSSISNNELTQEQLAELANMQKALAIMNEVIAKDNTVAKVGKDDWIRFEDAKKLSVEQLNQLIEIYKDGLVTNREIHDLSGFSREQRDELLRLNGIVALNETLANLDVSPEVNVSVDVNQTQVSYYSYTSNGELDSDNSVGFDTVVDSYGDTYADIYGCPDGYIKSGNTCIKGYATGGYTGDIPTTSIAGVVHGQEYVVNAQTTRDLGLNNSGGIFKEILSELKILRATTEAQNKKIEELEMVNRGQYTELNKLRKYKEDELI